MKARGPAVVRLAMSWVDAYTRTAPTQDRADRRAELASDLHEQLVDGRGRGISRARINGSVVGRVLRGVPADLTWRLAVEARAGRAHWHVSHPGTALAALFALLVPLAMATDGARNLAPTMSVPAMVLTPALILLSACTIGLGVVAVTHQLLHGPRRPTRVTPATVRRVSLSSMSVLWAVAAIWRFAPTPLASLSSAAWAGFGLALLMYAAALAISLLLWVVDFRKVPS